MRHLLLMLFFTISHSCHEMFLLTFTTWIFPHWRAPVWALLLIWNSHRLFLSQLLHTFDTYHSEHLAFRTKSLLWKENLLLSPSVDSAGVADDIRIWRPFFWTASYIKIKDPFKSGSFAAWGWVPIVGQLWQIVGCSGSCDPSSVFVTDVFRDWMLIQMETLVMQSH